MIGFGETHLDNMGRKSLQDNGFSIFLAGIIIILILIAFSGMNIIIRIIAVIILIAFLLGAIGSFLEK